MATGAKWEHKPNTFTAFPNEKKKSDNHPDYTGSGLFEGRECWVSLWVGETQAGKVKISGSVTPKDETASTRGGGTVQKQPVAGARPSGARGPAPRGPAPRRQYQAPSDNDGGDDGYQD